MIGGVPVLRFEHAMPVLRFGAFELDPEAGELRRQGRLVHLAAQPMRLLSLLAAKPGEVVTREELRRHVWGDGTFVEFDRSLNFCIASIRSTLRDDARCPRFIETLPRRGYRFLADVHVADPAAPVEWTAPAETRPTAHGKPRRSSGPWPGLLAMSLLLAQASAPPLPRTRTTAAPEARAAYERGMRLVREGAAGRRLGVHAFREAIRFDPLFAEAYYQLADVYLDLAGARELPPRTALAEAQAAAREAVALEPIAETRHLAGVLRLLKDWDWAGAERELAEVVRLEPAWDAGLVSYARLLSAHGDDTAALDLIDRAETLSPSCDLLLLDSATVYYRARRYGQALAKLERAETLGPPDGVGAPDWQRQIQWLRIRVRLAQGNWSEARKEALVVVRLHGTPAAAQERFARSDPREAVRQFFLRSASMMEPLAEAGRIPPTRLATAHAVLGQTDAALVWLERAADERDPDLVYELRNPDYDTVRSDPRFAALERRVLGPSRPDRSAIAASLVARLTFP